MLRNDHRESDELREISVVYEGLDRVDGSAKFGFGQTQSLVSVSGPIEVRLASELPSQATLEVHIRPVAAISGTDSKALGSTLKSILSPALLLSHNPRTLIQIVGQALCGSESGSGYGSAGRGWYASLVASLINAGSAALINAGSVPMRGVVCAVAVGRLSNPKSPSTTLILDPSESELALLSGGGCFAFLLSSSLSSVATPQQTDIPKSSLLWTNYTSNGSSFDESEFEGARQLAESGAVEVWKKLKESIATMDKRNTAPAVSKAQAKEEKVLAGSETEVDEAKMEI